MARPRNLGEHGKETVEKNFLEENPEITTDNKVVVANEVPKMEKIIFQNHRDQGLPLSFHYASKTHPLKHYELFHGQEYLLPVEIIMHLEGQNKSDPYACHRRLYGRRMKPDGVSETYVTNYVPYFRCQPVRA